MSELVLADNRQALVATVNRDRQELDSAVAELKRAVQRQTNVRWQIQKRPLVWVGGAFALGLLLGYRR